jgi:RNA polymerase sigma-70 factor (ECF subfamily)
VDALRGVKDWGHVDFGETTPGLARRLTGIVQPVGAMVGELGWVREDSSDRSIVRVNAAMDRYAAGDETAFSELYDLLAPRVYAFLLRQTRNPSRAEDLLQQTLLQMHCARATYDSGADVLPWAFAIARRLVIDGYRKSRREVIGCEEAVADSQRASPDRPDEMVEARQAVQRVERALETLPETQRIAFELVRCDGLSLNEAAQVLGTTVTAVKLRAHRTYEALRETLSRGGYTEDGRKKRARK